MATYTNRQIVNFYIENNFNKCKAAAAMGMSAVNLFRLINEREGLKDMMTEVEEQRIDMAEAKLQELISFGDFRAVKFFLDRKGRKRGYGQKVEIIKDEGDRKFSVVKIIDGEKVIELK